MNAPTFEQIIADPATDAEKSQFMAEQEFMRSIEWNARNLNTLPLNDFWSQAA
jgi:hypothetical protein